MMMISSLSLLSFLISVSSVASVGYVPFDGPIETVVNSPLPHTYLKSSDLPEAWDWRNVNGTNYCSKVLNQKNPAVCGSCWAEAATGALTDRYLIATKGKLNIQLAPQNLLNFNAYTSGGSCNGGDPLKAYDFVHKYGISEENCMPFAGLNWRHGFVVAGMREVDDVQRHQCHTCDWSGSCGFAPRDFFDLYGADEFGQLRGEEQMMAEIFARGPIACGINSSPHAFNAYTGGIITCEHDAYCRSVYDHLVVLTGWGVDKETGMKYWVGRNSYGTQWGEGAGRGWFRLERGQNTLMIESSPCSWAVPAAADVQRAVQQFDDSL